MLFELAGGAVILLDLRGFKRERAGVIFEMKLLAQNDRLKRVVALGNSETDWDYVDELFKAPHQMGFHEFRLDSRISKLEYQCIDKLMQLSL